MNRQKKRQNAFSLIELLVVIAIIALLLSITMPALTKAKEKVRAVICRSNLKQWGLITSLYAGDNESKLYQSVSGGTVTGLEAYWINASLPYYNDKKIRTCPSTRSFLPDRQRAWDNYGETFKTWGKLTEAFGEDWAEEFAVGSYGINDWAACPPPPPPDTYWTFPKAKAWKTTTAPGASNIPVFLDCAYLDGYPQAANTPDPVPEEMRLPSPWANGARVTGSWSNNSMRLFAIDRHNGTVNCAFLDASARRVGLKSLWNLEWHRDYTPIVPPQASWEWPVWMRSFK